FYYSSLPHPHPHPFPTRRSSDLAGTVIARIPRRAAILSWVARPASPSEASVPAPPPSMATNTRPSAPRRRSTWRQSSSIHTATRSEEHTSELQSRGHLVCRLLLE